MPPNFVYWHCLDKSVSVQLNSNRFSTYNIHMIIIYFMIKIVCPFFIPHPFVNVYSSAFSYFTLRPSTARSTKYTKLYCCFPKQDYISRVQLSLTDPSLLPSSYSWSDLIFASNIPPNLIFRSKPPWNHLSSPPPNLIFILFPHPTASPAPVVPIVTFRPLPMHPKSLCILTPPSPTSHLQPPPTPFILSNPSSSGNIVVTAVPENIQTVAWSPSADPLTPKGCVVSGCIHTHTHACSQVYTHWQMYARILS